MRLRNKADKVLFLVILVSVLLMVYSSTHASIPVPSLTVIDTIPVGGGPALMALTPDGTKLYVVNSPLESPSAKGSVMVVDTATKTVVEEIFLEVGFPFEIAITPDGSRAYLAVSTASGSTVSTGSSRVEVIDTSSDTIVATILIGGNPFGPIGVAITPDGSRAYISHRGDNRVDVIDTASNTVFASVSLEPDGPVPIGIAITPDGSRVYVANRGNSTVSVIDTATNAVVATVPVDIGPSVNLTSIALTPDGSRAYVTYSGDSEVAVIDTDPASPMYNQQVGIIATTGGNLSEITVTPDGSLAFVTSSATDEMLIIDTDPTSPNFQNQVGTVSVGDLPVGVVFQNLPVAVAYVSNSGNGTVSVIGLSVIEVTIDIKPGSFPNSINPKSKGEIPVAILTTDTFDATTVDPTTVLFGATGTEAAPVKSALEDVDGDEDTDMILHFKTQDTGIKCGDTSAPLTGETLDGQMIEGSDSIKTVGCK